MKFWMKRKLGLSLFIISCIVLSLAGCGKKNNYLGYKDAASVSAFKMGDSQVYMNEYLLYTFQYLVIHYSTEADALKVDEETLKKNILSQIREIKEVNYVAEGNGAELNESDMKTVQESFDGFKAKYGEDFFNAYGITDELLMKSFKEQALAAKFSNDIKNDMGKKVTSDLEEKLTDTHFFSLYMIIFPTVEKDANGNPKTDDQGNYVYVSEEEKKKQKEQAEKAIEEMNNGADYKEVIERYGVSDYCSSLCGYKDSLSETIYNRVKDVENGKCAQMLEETLGYTSLYVINNDDADLKNAYIQTLVSDTVESEFKTVYNKWLAVIPVDDEGDLSGTVIKDLTMKNVISDFYHAKSSDTGK